MDIRYLSITSERWKVQNGVASQILPAQDLALEKSSTLTGISREPANQYSKGSEVSISQGNMQCSLSSYIQIFNRIRATIEEEN